MAGAVGLFVQESWLWDGGHGKHPAFLPKEPKGTRDPCPWPASAPRVPTGTCFPLEKHLPSNIYRWSQVMEDGKVLSLWAACRGLRTLLVQQGSANPTASERGLFQKSSPLRDFGASLGKPQGISPAWVQPAPERGSPCSAATGGLPDCSGKTAGAREGAGVNPRLNPHPNPRLNRGLRSPKRVPAPPHPTVPAHRKDTQNPALLCRAEQKTRASARTEPTTGVRRRGAFRGKIKNCRASCQ